jgi:general secretion pathway protein E
MEERKNARQVQLSYLRHDNTPMPLPRADDPLATGLGTADQIVISALVRRSEIVDLSPMPQGPYALALVTDGVPVAQPGVDRTAAEAAIQAFKVLAGLSVEERRRPQSGTFRSRDAEGTTTVWTVKTSGSTSGEKVSLFANEKQQWNFPLDQLGFTSDQLAQVKKIVADTRGLVVITGPRGSGRTATCYALLRQHDAFTSSLQTLEVNPQSEMEGITVNKFDNKPDASFSKSLNSIFLTDPDVVFVSQIPDPPTAELVARYSGKGFDDKDPHRVYTTMTAGDSFTALEAWLAMASNKSEAAGAVAAVIAQRLVRVLCPTCKIPYQPDEATMKRLNLPIGRNLQSFKANTEPIVDRKGNQITCPDCAGTGFRGRTAIFEVLVLTDDMRKALASGANQNQIRAMARKNNLMLLVEHGIRKFATGVTAINEITRVLGGSEKPAGKTNVLASQK